MKTSPNVLSHGLGAALIDYTAVRTLVVEKLGCQCPDEVFSQLVVGVPSIFPGEDAGWAAQILVGFRLLVSLVSVQDLKSIREDVVKLLHEGRRLRERHGLNRFRLVLVGHLDKKTLEACQAEAQQMDERMHVHQVTEI